MTAASIVYVVHFDPVSEQGGVGGIEWDTNRLTLLDRILSLAGDLDALGGDPTRFSYYELELDFDPLADKAATTDYLDQRIVSFGEIPAKDSFVVGQGQWSGWTFWNANSVTTDPIDGERG